MQRYDDQEQARREDTRRRDFFLLALYVTPWITAFMILTPYKLGFNWVGRILIYILDGMGMCLLDIGKETILLFAGIARLLGRIL